ncbi:MAG: DEAD/DEAH box helicase [Deltaproteobacteria bacterium]|nr:DEAD/DEAH box helicase [Deltaproteobacteria bacterium]
MTATGLELFHAPTRAWFGATFPGPTRPQQLGWPAMARGDSTLLLAPTGTGKTLAAFLGALDQLMFEPVPPKRERCRVLYVSPLKALAVDIERNLRSPLLGIARAAEAQGLACHTAVVAVRTGDTPPNERARFQRSPADILVTTPESLYLLLTSRAREVLASVRTVILDEIHALVPTKRGSHLSLSMERLEDLCGRRLQRIGLSATQRPLEEVARFLGGADSAPAPRTRLRSVPGGSVARPGDDVHAEFSQPVGRIRYRPVTVVDAGSRKALELRIEVPVEDMARLGEPIAIPSGNTAQGTVRSSIWSAIHPRLLELVKAHRSTILFVNSRRVAERLANALNELAGETLVQAHHGSVARLQRLEIEDRLKAGQLRGLVATSSLELGIDMGAVDLVVQIEAPPSVASGLQRIGRAGHQVDAPSRGVLFPKYRADLLACAALTEAMHAGDVEPIRYPRNPLDVLAQQLVALASMEPVDVDEAYALVCRAAPFVELSRRAFEGVLDMLAGRYASDDFAELKPRLTWDRLKSTLRAREGAKQVAIVNGGTIPDRGLYGVFISGAPKGSARVGELDEEMVFESRVGETFVLGASSWRIEDITHDRVLVSPAPGVPGKMPFWHGDNIGRPLSVGRRIGQLTRELACVPKPAALARLTRAHDLDELAAENLLRYLDDQKAATGAIPDDRTIVVERTRDELSDWRICVLSPFGGRVHAPWAMAATARIRRERGLEVETMWTDDGFVVRFPDSEAPPDPALLLPELDELEPDLWSELGGTALFAARFRENAARALLLPKRRPGGRTPLWQTRKRAADLLAVAARFPSFPVILETYRECLRDVFDVPALHETLRQVRSRKIKVVTRDSQIPSPFASAILFGFVANYLYEGDAPLAERRAQALAIDHAQLRELLGEVALRELLEPDALEAVGRQLQRLEPHLQAKSADSLHDLLLRLGDLPREEIRARSVGPQAAGWLAELVAARRAVPVSIAGEERFVAVEDAGRYRDALGVALPRGLPAALLEPVAQPHLDLVHRYARTHPPFSAEELARRWGVGRLTAVALLERAVAAGRLLEGAFRPGGSGQEWCDSEVLKQIRRRSLAHLRHQVEPVEPRVLSRMLLHWQGVAKRRKGMDALLDTVEQLQGAALPASEFEREVLAARVEGYSPLDLDALAAAGEVVWVGVEPLGERDGRVALYLTDDLPRLWRRPPNAEAGLSEREEHLVGLLRERGASFFGELHLAAGGGYPGQTLEALWDLVFKGLVTNDLFLPLRAFTRPRQARGRRALPVSGSFRSRREAPPSAEGRWTLVESRAGSQAVAATDTAFGTALVQQLLARYGLVTREVPLSESVTGGFSAIYDVFKGMEESGRLRRGFFVSDVGAVQFAVPPVVDLLRSLREDPEKPEIVRLAATDPANAWGALLRWPAIDGEVSRGPARAVGAQVILVNGALGAYVGRGGRQIFTWLPPEEPERAKAARAVAEQLGQVAARSRSGFELEEINGAPARSHPLAPFLVAAGFGAGPRSFYWLRRPFVPEIVAPAAATASSEDEAPEERPLH